MQVVIKPWHTRYVQKWWQHVPERRSLQRRSLQRVTHVRM
jgi:hypothetical protein